VIFFRKKAIREASQKIDFYVGVYKQTKLFKKMIFITVNKHKIFFS